MGKLTKCNIKSDLYILVDLMGTSIAYYQYSYKSMCRLSDIMPEIYWAKHTVEIFINAGGWISTGPSLILTRDWHRTKFRVRKK